MGLVVIEGVEFQAHELSGYLKKDDTVTVSRDRIIVDALRTNCWQPLPRKLTEINGLFNGN